MIHPHVYTWASLLACAVLACAPLAWAQDATEPHISSPTIEPLLRMGLAVAAIGAAAWALGAWAKRRRIGRTGTDIKIDVLALRSLGPRQKLALIEVADRRFLIGVSGDAIRPIAELGETLPFERDLSDELQRDAEGERPALLGAIGRFEGLDG